MEKEALGRDIEISKEGIKISYLRYLADSASCFIIILAILMAYYAGTDVPGFGKLREIFVTHPGSEVKIAFLVLAFFVATPIGLVLNAIGWFLFGWLQLRLVEYWFN